MEIRHKRLETSRERHGGGTKETELRRRGGIKEQEGKEGDRGQRNRNGRKERGQEDS